MPEPKMQDLEKLRKAIDHPAWQPSTQLDQRIQLAIAEQTSRLADAAEGILGTLEFMGRIFDVPPALS